MVGPKIDIFTLEEFLHSREVERIVARMRSAASAGGSVSGGAKTVDPYVRQVLAPRFRLNFRTWSRTGSLR
jgi:hypothetical protein